jgi:hypothetical protein
MKESCVKCAQGRYPVDAALGENSREIAEIARECGATKVFAMRKDGTRALGRFALPDSGLVLVLCFPAADGGEPGVGEL